MKHLILKSPNFTIDVVKEIEKLQLEQCKRREMPENEKKLKTKKDKR